MAKKDKKALQQFLGPFEKDVIQRVTWLREFVWDLYPQSNELIYDNYNAVAVGWSPTDRVGHVFCNIAIGRTSYNVHFGFYWGSKLNDPEKRLIGEGSQYRYFLVTDLKNFPKTYIKKLLREAWAYSLSKVKDESQIMKGQTIVKSVSEKKRTKAPAKPSIRKSGTKKKKSG